jgi:branched-chain amino acid transport system substrate-binding protein
MKRLTTTVLAGALATGLAGAMLTAPALAQEAVKVGFILPMTGQQASTGRQVEAGARLYVAEHGDTVAGKKIELIFKDDGGVPDVTKRIAQELVVRDKVNVLAGFGLTPLAFAAAPVATQAKVPMVVTAAATSAITEKSPYIARTSFTLPQVSVGMADWAVANGIKKVVIIVSDYGPGNDAATFFTKKFTAGGGTVADTLKVPLQNPDFSPFLQRAKDAAPEAVFVFVPSGQGAVFMKQYAERGLAEAGIKLIATGDVLDDDLLDKMGDVALGVVNTHHYSAAHDSPENKAFVAAFKAANGGMRPNFMGVAGYDGMALIYKALEKTGGDTSGDALIAAMKGMAWTSPRGPVEIDPETRDIVQNVYVRKVERADGELYNVEFDTIEMVKDPAKAGL